MKWNDIVSLNNCGTALLRRGRQREATNLLATAAAGSSVCRSNFLLSLLYHPRLTPEQIAAAHFGQTDVKDPDPLKWPKQGRIRIGYLTPDFHFHPNAFLQIPHLRHFDRTQFEVFVYSSTTDPDEFTERARNSVERWRDVGGQSVEQTVRTIRQDRIEILIDVTGHFARSPLQVFARRAASLQVSIPGYPATTGLTAMDYKLVDFQTDPPGETEHLYSEKLFRLRRPIACFAPPSDAPIPGMLPFEKNGYMTFGCFNNRAKINPDIMRLWVEIASKTDNSRFLFHHVYGGHCRTDRIFREPIARFFRAHGISSRRLEFVGLLPMAEHLATIARADIALDTFPYNGMTTTMESLWMGVPVSSLAGHSHVSRTGVSLLTSAGLPGWAANSANGYIDHALKMARCPEIICAIRGELRTRMSRSPLTNSAGFIRSLEQALLTIWKRHRRA